MLKTRAYTWLALLCCLFVTIWYFFQLTDKSSETEGTVLDDRSVITSSSDSKQSNIEGTRVPQKDIVLSQDELAGYGDVTSDALGDAQLVQNLIEVFQYHLKYDDALPTAGNKELTAALLGENRYKDRFISADFEYINSQGEMTDRWGSPLIFHFEAAHCPDIRSIGPDKTPWTEDDVVLPYTFR